MEQDNTGDGGKQKQAPQCNYSLSQVPADPAVDAVTTIHLEEVGESCTDPEPPEAPSLAPLLSPTLAPGFVGSGSVSCRVSQRTLLETVGEDWVEEEIDTVDQEQDFRDAGR